MAALVARTLQAVLLLGSAVALARLLTPEDFGVFAMILPIGVISSTISNQCVQTALLQSRDLNRSELNGFFWFITRVNVLVAVGMAGSGFALASFFDEPRVVGVAAAWAATLLVLVPATFQEAVLKRGLRFPGVMAVQLTTLTIGVACSLFAAWRGAGYWALPIQMIVMELGRAAGIFLLSDWRPDAPSLRSKAEERPLRRAWLHIVGLRLSTWLKELPDIIVIGRLGGAVVLGNYHTARRWASFPFVDPFIALTDVTLASLRHVRDDDARFTRLVSRAFLVMLTVSLPIIAFVAVEAENVVLIALGPQWIDAVGFLRILSIAAFATALIRVNRWIYLARGRTRRLLAWSLFIETPATAIAVLAGLPWGAEGVATAIAIASVALVLPAALHGVRGSPLSSMDVLRAVFRPTVASIVGALAVALAAPILPTSIGMLRLVATLSLFGVVFAAVWHLIPGGVADTKLLLGAARDLAPARRRTYHVEKSRESL